MSLKGIVAWVKKAVAIFKAAKAGDANQWPDAAASLPRVTPIEKGRAYERARKDLKTRVKRRKSEFPGGDAA